MKQHFFLASLGLALGAALFIPGASVHQVSGDDNAAPITQADNVAPPAVADAVKHVTPEELLTLGKEKLEAIGDWKISSWMARALVSTKPPEIQELLKPALNKSTISAKTIMIAFAEEGKAKDIAVSAELVAQAADLLAYKQIKDEDGSRAAGLARYAAYACAKCNGINPATLREAVSKDDDLDPDSGDAPPAPLPVPVPSL